MSTDKLHERGQALEDLFFKNRDSQLLEKIKKEANQKEARVALASVSGITDDAVLNGLIELNINAETLASLAMVPLVAVAWADNRMEKAEIDAVLKAADQNGIQSGTSSYSMIESWLSRRPENELLDAWTDYITALRDVLDPAAFGQLKTSVMGKAKDVADAAGGFLGFGATSDVEQKVLDRLEAAFG